MADVGSTRVRADIRAMVDANVIVAAAGWPRWPYEVVAHSLRGDFQLVLAPIIIEQARQFDSPKYPQVRAAIHRLTAQLIYEGVPDPTPAQIERNKNLIRDSGDVPVALAALNAEVDYLVTSDADLTDRYPANEPLHRAINVILPAVFLKEVMGWTSEQLEAIRYRTFRDLTD